MQVRLTRMSTTLTCLVLLTAAVALLIFAAIPSGGAAEKRAARVVGKMYTQTNGKAKNEVLVFNRLADGSLKFRQAVSTGGKGGYQPEPGCDPPGGCPLLDSQGSVQVTHGGKLVFAVNAGSNSISSFFAGKQGLRRVDKISSRGVFPNSLTIHGHLLYVLNANSESIAGFRFTDTGNLSQIGGSVKPLTPEAAPLARQIGFDNTGKVLVVTQLTDATFDTFKVTNGVAGPAKAHPSASPEPFAFDFDPDNHMVVSEVVNDQDFNQFSNGSSYSVSGSGAINPISTVPTRGYAACWVEITQDGRFAFMVNTGGPSPYGATVTTFAISGSGKLAFKGVTTKGDEFTLTDEALSRDNKYLYVVSPLTANPFTNPPPTNLGSKIVTFKVSQSGGLKRVGETTKVLAPGLSGLDGT